METKTVSKPNKSRAISLHELRTCPKHILSASHWTPVHKVEECGADKQLQTEVKVESTPKHPTMFYDSEINCAECGASFIWTAGEQRFLHKLYDEGKIQEVIEPRRCPPCRKKKKERIAQAESNQQDN